eukprot:TRINITY_DN47256_c0_g1_i1.p1 TRINITY_DN47256_c0_g1~~TRINITY_DN47256_c0_g1_i1.p1  ORF type:complete len:321 (+),score=60.32 TRINITY_DN47256_c0_g1_i1:51-965(+)
MALLHVGILLCLIHSEGVRRNDGVEVLSSSPDEVVVKNAAQKAWAAAQLVNFEHKMCGRHNFPIRQKVKWWWEKCPEGWNDLGFLCRTCDGESEGPFACWERCGPKKNLPQLPFECANLYCVKTVDECWWKMTKLTLRWAQVAINLVMNLELLDTLATEIVEHAQNLLAVEALIEGVLQPTIDNIIWRGGKKIAELMLTDNLTNQTKEAIIRGGAEIVAASAAAALKDYFKSITSRIMKAIDLTGITKAIEAFDGGERCRDIMVTPMPKENLVEESVSPKLGARVFSVAADESLFAQARQAQER